MMVSRTLFEEAYRREGIMDCSASSVLCHGRNNKTGAPVLVRHWLSARDLPEDAIQALHSEVAAWQACQHTHLLPFLDGFANEQGLYLVSASPSGGTLATRLAQHFLTVLPFDEALRIILQTGQALQALHQHGLSHGNLTPQAVFFDAAGQVCLGEGRLRSVLHCLPSNRPGLEESIPLCWYMAPEQFAGGWNALTDQYALGCLAYHVLTGRVPFTGSARATLRQKHEREQPAALRERHPSLPLSVESAVLKALAKQPEERHHSVQAFLDALQPPSKAHAGDLDRTAGPWMVGGVEITAQTTLVPEEFLSSSSPASPTSTESRKTAQTRWQRVLAAGNQSWRQIAPRLALAVTRHSTGDRVSLTLPLRSPIGEQKRLLHVAHGRKGVVLGSAVLLILGLTVLTGHWFVSTGLSRHPVAGSLSPSATQTLPGVTPADATTPVPTTGTPALSPTPHASPTPALFKVVPLLDCVTPTGNTLHAAFGYHNANPAAVLIPFGTKNAIEPSRLDGSQPTSFAPGFHHRVFQVTFSKHGTATWSLNGQTVTANSNSPSC